MLLDMASMIFKQEKKIQNRFDEDKNSISLTNLSQKEMINYKGLKKLYIEKIKFYFLFGKYKKTIK